MEDDSDNNDWKIHLQHVGSAAAMSGSHMMAWVDDDHYLAYGSHGMIHLAAVSSSTRLANGVMEPNLLSIQQSLRTTSSEGTPAIVTALAAIQGTTTTVGLVAGSSDGSIHVWFKQKEDAEWVETRIIRESHHAVTVIDAVTIGEERNDVLIAWGTSTGAHLVRSRSDNSFGEMETVSLNASIPFSIKSVYFLPTSHDDSHPMLLAGTASPKNNQIYFVRYNGTIVGSLAGHEDWVTGLAYQAPLLASASQDARIRLWKFTDQCMITDDEDETRLEIPSQGGGDQEQQQRTFISLDAILYGHEESVTSVCWHPKQPVLISSGLDRIILLWSEGVDGVWAPISRVGSAGGILGGSIGSSLLGYNSAMIHRDGNKIIGHAYGGALHAWTWSEESESDHGQWQAAPCVTGHFGPVTDLCWDTQHGDYLLTVGSDQTCRLWSLIASTQTWVELARPQVHGYNLSAIACVSSSLHPHRIATGGEEKEIRVFDAPKTSLNMLQAVCGIDDNGKENDRVERAFIPSLGLSNKASAADAAEEDTPSAGNYESPVHEMRLPVERDLGAVSLWPEVQKLFGHNTEIYTLASSYESKTHPRWRHGMESEAPILASSTKAREVEDASIRLWDTVNGKCVQILSGAHKSTVASLAFSPDSNFLVSAGKDRKIVVWKRENDSKEYSLAFVKESAHKRIIWSTHFCPFDPNILATGSRDGTVKLWRVALDGSLELAHSFSPQFTRAGKPDAVTSLSFAPSESDTSRALLALGLESGRLELLQIDMQTLDKTTIIVSPSTCHIAAITRMAWRPLTTNDSKPNTLHLATCSADHSCRIFTIARK